MSRGGVSDEAASWMERGSIPSRRKKTSSPKHPDWLWAHRASYSKGTGFLFRVNQPKREANHSPPPPPSCAVVKNGWSYNSTPPIRFHGVDGASFLFTYFGG